ncbi:cytochrome b/b6 domain-containing protein [Rhizobium sp. FY34]|uniref:cytochrome b/b6 domain-containing protein n=1 Tax=Rhizobium sp. FY34 TaxID=2562309 RepID=UPI0010C12793|nr:cytochrome b/b6 domain-containing protein [Rhizobium sp. FY34]
MSDTHSVRAYSMGAMILHWLIAALILTQLAVGFLMSRVDSVPDTLRFAMFQWHKTFGVAVLTLTIARIAWRLFHTPPAHAPMSRAEATAASIVHVLFYALMLIVPLTGWLLVSASSTGIPTFLFLSQSLVWPHIFVPTSIRATVETVSDYAHIILAYGFGLLLVLHVAGALKHSLIDKMPSFSRMLPLGWLTRMPSSAIGALVSVVLALCFIGGGLAISQTGAPTAVNAANLGPTSAAPSGWVIDKAKSKLAYSINFSGTPTAGTIGTWDATVDFDPDNLAAAKASISIAAASVDFDNPFVKPNISGDDGLQTAAHPLVEVVLDRFERAGAAYIGHGNVLIRGATVPVSVAFDMKRDETGRAIATGSAELDRLVLGLGLQNDAKGEWLDKLIRVSFTLEASPSGPTS